MSLTFKSIDTMKASRDQNPVWSEAQIQEHINSLNNLIPGCTHMTICCYANNFGFHSVAHIKQWSDAIHATGKAVFWRLIIANPAGTLNGITTQIMTYCEDLLTCFENGDWIDPYPESNPANNPTNWNAWAVDVYDQMQAYFTSESLTINTDLWSVTDTNVITNKHITDDTVLHLGNKVCIDFYPMDLGASPAVKVQSLIGQIQAMRVNYPTADIYITETGYNNLSSVTDADQYEVLSLLFRELETKCPYVKGFNYWCSFNTTGGGGYTNIYQTNSRTLPRPAVAALRDYYDGSFVTGRKLIV